MTSMTTPEEYQVPRIHQFNSNQPEQMGNINSIEMPSMPDTVQINPSYDCKGLKL